MPGTGFLAFPLFAGGSELAFGGHIFRDFAHGYFAAAMAGDQVLQGEFIEFAQGGLQALLTGIDQVQAAQNQFENAVRILFLQMP